MAALSVGSGSAADLRMPVIKGPVVVPHFFTWSGCYVGGNLGYYRSQFDSRITFDDVPGGVDDPVPETYLNDPLTTKGFTGGGQVGCQYQVNHFVVGVEGDYNWTNRNSEERFYAPDPVGEPFDSVRQSVSMKSLYSVRGRVGLAEDRALVYVTAGWAGARFDHSFFLNDGGATGDPFANAGQYSYTSNGVVLGAGVQYALTDNWIIGAEFLHFSFGDAKYLPNSPAQFFPGCTSCGVGPWIGDHITLRQADEVRIRLDYKFGSWPFGY